MLDVRIFARTQGLTYGVSRPEIDKNSSSRRRPVPPTRAKPDRGSHLFNWATVKSSDGRLRIVVDRATTADRTQNDAIPHRNSSG